MEITKAGVYVGHKIRPAMSNLPVIVIVTGFAPFLQIRIIDTEQIRDIPVEQYHTVKVIREIEMSL